MIILTIVNNNKQSISMNNLHKLKIKTKKCNDYINNFIDIFNTQQSQNLNILDIIPESTTQLFAISFNNQQKLYERKMRF